MEFMYKRKFVLGCAGGIALMVVGSVTFFLMHKPVDDQPLQQATFLEAERNMFEIREESISTPYGTFQVKERVIFDLIQLLFLIR